MTRKLGLIVAVRENTWMIRIPMGCDPQIKQRSYYNRTVHGSLRQAQKFLGKKVNELGAYIERDGAKIRLDQYLDQWLKTVKSQICSKTFEGYESSQSWQCRMAFEEATHEFEKVKKQRKKDEKYYQQAKKMEEKRQNGE